MLERLEQLVARYEELNHLLADPAVMEEQDRYPELLREHSHLQAVAAVYEEQVQLRKEIDDCDALLNEEADDETRTWLQEERDHLAKRLQQAELQTRKLLVPRDSRDDKNVIVEIRAGTGGDEAGLFAGDLLRMYTRYGERQGWRAEIISLQESDIGGLKEAVVEISGREVFSRMKFESGVHRVQRVPATESGGRIHTSAATVAVMPEAEEFDVEIRQEDLKIDTYRASGAGGQHVNKTESAIRITHLPSGLVVTCQDGKSQHKNKERAMKVLRARLYDQIQAERHAEEAAARRVQVGSGDRSERIRTYNFPQSRVTDHRINLTLHRLDEILAGDLDELVDALTAAQEYEELRLVT